MSLNSAACFVMALANCLLAGSALCAEVCPARKDQPLRFVDVFDGPAEQMATLVPDRGDDRSGYWRLGYVYDAGRVVVVRCKYADGSHKDVTLSNRISRCDYKVDRRKVLRVSCK